MGMTINISMGTKDYEFYNVPEKVGKAIIRKIKSNDACCGCLYRGSGTQDYLSICNTCHNFNKYESYEDCIAEGGYIREDGKEKI